jgi:hypothetical protein
MFAGKLTGFLLPFLFGLEAWAQEPAFPPPPEAPAATPVAAEADAAAEPPTEQTPPEFRPGFEGGLRLGLGLPVGKAGQGADGVERDLSDLTEWRAPFWVDIAYRVSKVSSYGVYAQFGVGKTGDGCQGNCDWSDIRVGAQGQWRLNPDGSVDPWLGLGLGYEWLSYQTLTLIDVGIIDEETGNQTLIANRTTELIGGPELMLQGGLEFRVEDSLVIGPFVTASLGQYLGDSYKCDAPIDLTESLAPCPGGSAVEGSGFHSWIGLGLAGRYSP